MAVRKKLNLSDFAARATKVDGKHQQNIKGGYKRLIGGAGSTGLIDWSEIDIRSNDPVAGDRVVEIKSNRSQIM